MEFLKKIFRESGTKDESYLTHIKKAKQLESRLETKIQRYSALAQKINADLLCDEENPLAESGDEQVR